MTKTTHLLTVLALVGAMTVTGCGGGSAEASDPLQTGVYEWELSEQYLLDHGIPTEQARTDSGHQEVTLSPDGTFVATWRTAENTTGSCLGTYEEHDSRLVTFKWTSGCFGDWEMRYTVDGDTVTWSDQKALPPYDSDDAQNGAKTYNSIPWTRVGDAS
jgi:hypothetical protein